VTDVPAADPRALDLLRADLQPWTVDAATDLLGPVASDALAREDPVPAARVLERQLGREPIAALVAAFVLGRPVRRSSLDAALPRLGVEGAVRLGLLDAAGAAPQDDVRALCDLQPYAAVDATGTAQWWVASDLGELAVEGPLRPDYVLGVGGASVTLAQCTVPGSGRPGSRALDLGTGCGVQSLHLSRGSAEVTATDVSQRALAFARFTLALNSRDVRLLHGDLLEPVAGERFDLVVSNPPFVITPRRDGVPAYEYRDGGLEGDELVRRLLVGLGPVLTEGGVAQVLGNWEHRRGQGWSERVTAWLEAADAAARAATGCGLDAWVVQREVQDPAEYAALWVRDGGDPGPMRRAELVRAWLDDFENRDVEAVGFGLVTLRLRRDAAPGRTRVEEQRGGLDTPVGAHVADCLRAWEWLAERDDSALAAAHLRHGDRVGLVDLVSRRAWLRPGAGRRQLLRLRVRLALTRSHPDAPAIVVRPERLPRGVVVVLLSPLLDDVAVRVAVEAAERGARVLCVDVLPDPIQPDLSMAFAREALDVVLAEHAARRETLAAQGIAVLRWEPAAVAGHLARWVREQRTGSRGGSR